jgi:phosphatidylserine/phosphatidylglycerophosphate/cardiolipin synthase-like enzyme
MHAKLTVVDDVVFTGSYNLSRSGERNAENVLEIEDAALADRLTAYVDEVRSLYPRFMPEAEASAGERDQQRDQEDQAQDQQ